MKRPPAIANLLLSRFGTIDPALVGDLHQEWATGRSRRWFWRQTIAAIAWGTLGEVRRMPAQTCTAVLVGWLTVTIVFLKGDFLALGLAQMFTEWARQGAFSAQTWPPYYIASACVSYGGFGFSAWLVARVFRKNPAMLMAYAGATLAVLVTATIVMNVLVRQGRPIHVIHPLFYAVSVTLPFHWYSGVVLVPLFMLLCGGLARHARPSPTH